MSYSIWSFEVEICYESAATKFQQLRILKSAPQSRLQFYFAENVHQREKQQISLKIYIPFTSAIRDLLPQESSLEQGFWLLFYVVCALDLSNPSCVHKSH